MSTKIFTLTLLFLLVLLPLSGSAQRLHLSRAAQKKLNATFLREGSSASAARIRKFLAEGATVLMHAAQYDAVETVKTLIGLHARVNTRDRSGRTALFYVFMGNGRYHPSRELVTTLMDAGGDINAVSKYGETPLKMALALHHARLRCRRELP